MAKRMTAAEMLRQLLDALTPAPVPAAPAAAPVKAKAEAPFITFLAERHAAAITAGTHVRCEVPGCSGIMSKERTTVLKGHRACKRHF